jgi:hypothetical protein
MALGLDGWEKNLQQGGLAHHLTRTPEGWCMVGESLTGSWVPREVGGVGGGPSLELGQAAELGQPLANGKLFPFTLSFLLPCPTFWKVHL